MRLIFMGTPDFAVPSLDALIARAECEIVAVYTQAVRPAGRGMRLCPSPVQRLAAAHDLPIFAPTDFRPSVIEAQFRAHHAELTIVIAYGQLLPPSILAVPLLGCWNLHASLLPRWRGAAPIQHAIMAGDRQSGISLMQMDKGLDTGDILSTRALQLDDTITGGALHDLLAQIAADVLCDAIDAHLAGRLPPPRPQDETTAIYASKLTTDSTCLKWNDSAERLARQCRALAPHPGAWFLAKTERLKAYAGYAELAPQRPSVPIGTVIDARPAIQCGDGVLVLTELQRAGGRAMMAADFQRGAHRLRPMMQLE